MVLPDLTGTGCSLHVLNFFAFLAHNASADTRRRLWTEVITLMGPVLGLRAAVSPLLLLSLIFSNRSKEPRPQAGALKP